MSDPITGTLAALILAAQWRITTSRIPRWRATASDWAVTPAAWLSARLMHRTWWRNGGDIAPVIASITAEHPIVTPRRHVRVTGGRLHEAGHRNTVAAHRAGARLHHRAAHHAGTWRPRRLRTAVAA